MALALQQLPTAAAAWFNYGLAQHLCGRIPAAVRAYRRSLACPDPPLRQLANNLSQYLLLSGCFAEGWHVY